MTSIWILLLSTSLKSPVRDTIWVVNYHHEVYKPGKGVIIPKVAVPEEYREAIGKDSADFTSVLFPMQTNLRMEIAKDGSYRMTRRSTKPGITLASNATMYFRKGAYYTSLDSTKKDARKVKVKKTNEQQVISGYRCTKFLITYLDNQEVWEAWATKGLPGSITGHFRLPAFGYAVLQMRDLDGTGQMTVSSIEKVPMPADLFD